MIELTLPSLGADMDKGKLLEWKIHPGDVVKRGDIVAVVDTAKAAVDVESWGEGVVIDLLVPVGETVPVGTPIALLGAPGETREAGDRTRLEPSPSSESFPAPAPVPERPPGAQTVPPPRARLTPLARRRAGELGVDPARLGAGSGPEGAVTVEDVEAAAARTSADARSQAMRQQIAAAMSRSKREIPHYYLSEPVPMRAALQWLQARNAASPVAERILPAVMLIKAVALATRDYPDMNGFWLDGRFRPAPAAHVGVAISLREGGLIAPALHDAADKPLGQLMREMSDLVRRARAGSLKSSEMSDPSITVSNLGEQGVETVFGVIYPPQVALVGFGAVRDRPWVESGRLTVAPVLTASLAADHRASDGHRGALFLAAIRARLESPDTL